MRIKWEFDFNAYLTSVSKMKIGWELDENWMKIGWELDENFNSHFKMRIKWELKWELKWEFKGIKRTPSHGPAQRTIINIIYAIDDPKSKFQAEMKVVKFSRIHCHLGSSWFYVY